jgi:hypothetical protein
MNNLLYHSIKYQNSKIFKTLCMAFNIDNLPDIRTRTKILKKISQVNKWLIFVLLYIYTYFNYKSKYL